MKRRSRWLGFVIAVALGAASLIGIAAPPRSGAATHGAAAAPAGGAIAEPTKSPEPPGAGNPTASFPDSSTLRAEGLDLYQQSCSSCHGLGLDGVRGVAPSLRDVGAGPVDFYLSTGRMPLQSPKDEPARSAPLFDSRQIDALIAYISSHGGPAAPTANPSLGNLAVGDQVFTENCAGCHQIVGRGGLTLGAYVPDLSSATAQQIAEAIRVGPYVMPRFSARQINQPELDSLARYVLYTHAPDNAGGWGIYNIGPIPEGIVAWFLGLLALVIVARLIGERTSE